MSIKKTMRLSELNCFRRESVKPVETCQRAKEIEEAMEFNEVMQALRKQKNEKLAERGDEIESLKMEMGKFRRSSLADKEVIDDLYRQIEDKNIVVREHDNLIKELRQKEQTIEDLKRQNSAKEKEEKEKIHRLGQEIEYKNIKLHTVNQQIGEQTKAKKNELDAVKRRCSKIEINANTQKNVIMRLKNEIEDKEVELRDHDLLLKSKLNEKEQQIAVLRKQSTLKQMLADKVIEAEERKVHRLSDAVTAEHIKLQEVNEMNAELEHEMNEKDYKLKKVNHQIEVDVQEIDQLTERDEYNKMLIERLNKQIANKDIQLHNYENLSQAFRRKLGQKDDEIASLVKQNVNDQKVLAWKSHEAEQRSMDLIAKLRKKNKELMKEKKKNELKRRVSTNKIKADKDMIDRLHKKIDSKKHKSRQRGGLLRKLRAKDKEIADLKKQMEWSVNCN